MPKDNNKKVLNCPPLRFPEFTGEWEANSLKSVCKIDKGAGISKAELSETGEPCILYGELYTKYKSEIINEIVSKTNIPSDKLVRSRANDVIIPCSGETAIDIATARCIPYDNILLGGDLNILRLSKKVDGAFLSYQLNGTRRKDIAKVAQGVSVVHLYPEHIKGIKVYIPTAHEQKKIAKLISLLDERIATQNKIIEDLKKLESAIIEASFSTNDIKVQLSNLLVQQSTRNRRGLDLKVLSVSNKHGFIAQSEQFEDREIASEDTSNYKVVSKGMFAYNPARINVGSIALYKDEEQGIVSPMYVCFSTKKQLLPLYLKHFLSSNYFQHEMYKRLEGSVRLCLVFDGLCNIQIPLPNTAPQQHIANRIDSIDAKIQLELKLLGAYNLQRSFLLSQMFI